MDEISKLVYGEDEEYLEHIKQTCEKFKNSNNSICEKKEYLFFEEVIKENLGPITDCGLKRDLNKNLSN